VAHCLNIPERIFFETFVETGLKSAANLCAVVGAARNRFSP
jgi:hypothetical protein